MSKNKLTLICSTFIGTINHLHFILLFVFTSCRTISYFSSSSHFVYGAECYVMLASMLAEKTDLSVLSVFFNRFSVFVGFFKTDVGSVVGF